MTNIFLVSDTHFGHSAICKFMRSDGITPLRPWDDTDEMDAALIDNWNSVVKPKDTVFHLGDVVMNRRHLVTMKLLNGRKKLILGNHDIFDHSDYTPHFIRLHGSHKLDNLLLSHIPLHPSSVPHWATANVHGHLHHNQVNKIIHGQEVLDPKYLNVCVEHTNYIPISLEDVKQRIKKNKDDFISKVGIYTDIE